MKSCCFPLIPPHPRIKNFKINLDGRLYLQPLFIAPRCLRMKCPNCHKHESVVKHGIRNTSKGAIQRYFCRTCEKSFSGSTVPHTKYPLNVIMYTLEQYNRGYPVEIAKKRTGKKYQYSPPIQTIYSWIQRYKPILTFLKLRKNYNIDPTTLTTTHNFQHQQVYPFTYHHLKLNIHSKQRPELRRYINWLERSLDRKMFLSGPRCSSLKIEHNTSVKQKDNISPNLTRLALNSQPKNTKKSPHEIVQDFFLINDSTTVATELPVFINSSETDLEVDEPITGHIDIVQIRYDNHFILDYKPNLNRPEQYASQLILYKEAIQRRTSIPEDKIKMAVFNEYGYYEFE